MVHSFYHPYSAPSFLAPPNPSRHNRQRDAWFKIDCALASRATLAARSWTMGVVVMNRARVQDLRNDPEQRFCGVLLSISGKQVPGSWVSVVNRYLDQEDFVLDRSWRHSFSSGSIRRRFVFVHLSCSSRLFIWHWDCARQFDRQFCHESFGVVIPIYIFYFCLL